MAKKSPMSESPTEPGPTVLRMKKAEEYLRGKSFTIETMTAAGDIAVKEITPITDVRGRSEYRFQLARNVLKKYYYQEQETAQ